MSDFKLTDEKLAELSDLLMGPPIASTTNVALTRKLEAILDISPDDLSDITPEQLASLCLVRDARAGIISVEEAYRQLRQIHHYQGGSKLS